VDASGARDLMLPLLQLLAIEDLREKALELAERLAGLEIVEERVDGEARPREHRCAHARSSERVVRASSWGSRHLCLEHLLIRRAQPILVRPCRALDYMPCPARRSRSSVRCRAGRLERRRYRRGADTRIDR